MSTVLEFGRRAPKPIASDMLDLGEAMCVAGHTLVRAGNTVLSRGGAPSDGMLREAEATASQMLAAVQAIRLAMMFRAPVELPADCEAS